MKKILSIAIVSTFACLTMAQGANALQEDSSPCVCTSDEHRSACIQIAREIQDCGLECCNMLTSNARESDLNLLLELMDQICADNSQDSPSKPETDNDSSRPEVIPPEDSKPETEKPDQVLPENPKPETEKPEQTPPENNTPDTDNPSDTPEEDSSGNSNTSEKAMRDKILSLVNKERQALGLSKLSESSTLTNAANRRASEQAVLFSHTRPDGSSWTTVLSQYGIKYSSAGENVAYGQDTPEEVMTAWMSSQGHRENILNGTYKEIGIGIYYKNGTYYWSQLFIS